MGTAGYQMRRPVVMSWRLGLEEISQANLPRVVAASRLGASHLTQSVGSCLDQCDVGGLATSNVVVGGELQVCEQRDAHTYVDTEV